jgi:hypothetical protein
MANLEKEEPELAWFEVSFIDPAQQRDCRSRLCIDRGSYTPVWDEALESLQLGIYIEDPTSGPITH